MTASTLAVRFSRSNANHHLWNNNVSYREGIAEWEKIRGRVHF